MRAVFVFCLFLALSWKCNGVPHELLGAKQCTWGPSYWCSNLTSAAGCHAVKHCIQTVWEHQELPPDTDTVCQTCLKMVKQARDQLLSNETEEEIQEVFEGSCKLIPIKIVNEGCCKLVDEFIPELVDTLASQMNPQVVCSVAGLCNNERVDNLLAEHSKQLTVHNKPDSCEGCHTVIHILQKRFESMSRDQVLQNFLQVCGHLGSLSDACSNIVVTYFKEIYEHLQNNFNSNDVCLLSGECSTQFHTHANIEIIPLSNVGFVPVEQKDDLPCELCEQLVAHLRDLLIANTTEDEFKTVLEGLCKQTQQFSQECQSLVEEYYGVIYGFLVNNLNGTVACGMIGICPQSAELETIPIAPLLPVDSASKALEMVNDNGELHPIGVPNEGAAIKIMQKPENMQLPIERIFPPHLHETYNQQVCVFCEYLLHYLQQVITNPSTEEQIKDYVDKACGRLPLSINSTCVDFIDTYGDAVVALLAQEIDPSTICPLIRACPSPDAKNVEVFMEEKGDQPKCPLCLFAVTKLEEMVEDKNTEDNIRNALNSLCSHFSGNIASECQDAVNTYTDTLIELLIADLIPQEVCVYLKLCEDKMPPKPVQAVSEIEDLSIMTNEIPDYTKNGEYILPIKGKPKSNKPQCVICEFAMTKLQDLLQNKTTDEEIKEAVLSVCNHLPKSVRGECSAFTNKYADLVIQLVSGALQPDEVCAYIGLCDKKVESRFDFDASLESKVTQNTKTIGSPLCAVCKLAMGQLERFIVGNMTKEQIENALYGICAALPRSEEDSCNEFINKYGDTIVSLLQQAAQPQEICSLMFLCSSLENQMLKDEIFNCSLCKAMYANFMEQTDLSDTKTLGMCTNMSPKYKAACEDTLKVDGGSDSALIKTVSHFMKQNEQACHTLNYCKGLVPYIRRRREVELVGANKCTWGPGYWCHSLANANECGEGAKAHCVEKVWKGSPPSS